MSLGSALGCYETVGTGVQWVAMWSSVDAEEKATGSQQCCHREEALSVLSVRSRHAAGDALKRAVVTVGSIGDPGFGLR